MAGLHEHRCECGRTWEHELSQVESKEDYEAAHHCTKCGAEVTLAHFKTKEAEREFQNIMAERDPFYAIALWLLRD